jgi:CRP-like cAMP-binding protein
LPEVQIPRPEPAGPLAPLLRDPIASLLRGIERRGPIGEADRRAVLALPHRVRTLAKGEALIETGSEPQVCGLLLSGWLHRQKVSAEGVRAIVALLIPGDPVDIQNLFLAASDHDAVALTEAKVMLLPQEPIEELLASSLPIARALWIDTLVSASISREWLVNVGRRSAVRRVAHLLCEMAMRLRAARLLDGTRFTLPLTQTEIGDATGLTSVHVSRVFRVLETERLIGRDNREIEVLDWRALTRRGEFDGSYLHLDEYIEDPVAPMA